MSDTLTTNEKSFRRMNWLTRTAYPYASVLPALLVILLFTIYPVFYAVRISFYQVYADTTKFSSLYRIEEFS